MGDRRKCQTHTASPAEPGGLPVMLASIETIRRDFGVIVTELQMRADEFFPTPTSSTSVRDANG
jgi:hypothetical protein